MSKSILHIKLSFIDDPALSWKEFMYIIKGATFGMTGS